MEENKMINEPLLNVKMIMLILKLELETLPLETVKRGK